MTRREYRLPPLGEGLAQGRLVAWRAAPGERVEAGQPLCEVETEKANFTFDLPETGWLVEIAAATGAVVTPGALLAVYDTAPPAALGALAYRSATTPAAAPAPVRRDGAFERVYSGAQWESVVGYCRAVRAGPLVVVSGTAPVGPDGGTWAPGEFFAGHPPATTMVELRRLVAPDMLIEIEAEAYAPR